MNNTNISFVMPIKNAAPFVGEALSWLAKPEIVRLGNSIEVILVDDGSSDNPHSALKKTETRSEFFAMRKTQGLEKYRR